MPTATAPTFDVFRTEDETVSKYIHEDGSETAVKLVQSMQNVLNPLTRAIETRLSDRNKYSVFISSSVGCYMSCPFCHLTLKDSKYRPLSNQTVLANLKEALLDKLAFNPDLANRYVKLSWMGMGDAVNVPDMVHDTTLDLLDWILANGLAKGLDGVDLSTVLPPVKPAWIERFQALDRALGGYPKNPVYAMDNAAVTTGEYRHRTPFRMFYSIHSAVQALRDKTVPKALPLAEAVPQLKAYAQDGAHSLIFHHLLVAGLNDSEAELEALAEWMNTHFPDSELRILRYNLCAKSPYKESDTFLRQIRWLSDHVNFLKVQISPGNEVSAACGQFIVKDFIRRGKQAA
jgi:adenine C2-methylase RlmN of 23S rRNA A2503 and tRNA A37